MSRIDFTSPFAGFPMVKHYNNSENLLQNNKPNWSVHKDSDLEFEGAPPEMRPLLNLLRHSRSKTESYPYPVEFMDNRGDFNETSLIWYTQINQNCKKWKQFLGGPGAFAALTSAGILYPLLTPGD